MIAHHFVTFLALSAMLYPAWAADKTPPPPIVESPLWTQAKALLKAEGETLDTTQLLTAGLLDKDNFGAIPNLKDLALVIDRKPRAGDPGKRRLVLATMGEPFEAPDIPSLGAGPETGNNTDLVLWARYIIKRKLALMPRASSDVGRALVEALDLAYPALPHLVRAGTLPGAVFTPAPMQRGIRSPVDGLPSVEFPNLRGVANLLSLRAIASIDAHSYPDAAMNLGALHRLTLAFANEPTIPGQIQAISTTSQGNNAAWHLLASRTATAEVLTEEQKTLEAIDLRASMLRAWRCEMAMFIGAIEATEAVDGGPNVTKVFFPGDEGGQSGNLVADLLFTGPPQRIGEAKAAYVMHLYQHCIRPLKADGLGGFLRELESHADAFRPLPIDVARTDPGKFIGLSFMRQIGKLPQAAVQAQTTTDQARLACAIERFALNEKRLPTSLAELSAKYIKPLPTDLFDGKTIRYRQIEGGRYQLWSVGPNRQDDNAGGDDFIWSYTPLPPPAAPAAPKP